MNSREFQELCSNLKEKYEVGGVTDDDVDMFADIISNVLGRDDLKADGTSYAELSKVISGNYENDVNMTPLLARLYETCRMYERYRPRPLTETEAKSIMSEMHADAPDKKRPVTIVARDGLRRLASCWWDDLSDIGGTAAKVSEVVGAMPVLNDGSDPAENAEDEELLLGIAEAFAEGNAGFDPLDADMAEMYGDSRPVASERESGIVEILSGIQRNDRRGGGNVNIDLRSRRVFLDNYIQYGLEFYREITGDGDFTTEGLPVITADLIDYPFSAAQDASGKWAEMPDVFAMPNPKMVGAKRPVRHKSREGSAQ